MKKRKVQRRRSLVELIDRETRQVEADFGFWLWHVIHWHLLLLAAIMFLYIGYVSQVVVHSF
jgi:hypothetical protein